MAKSGGEVRHGCTTGVNQLLVSGDMRFYITNHPKGNGVGYEDCTVQLNTKSISYIQMV
ncbi:hypothetical protein [Bacillus wiedmannii]|uniref:hypothetical protein n=1 Tax=Bacillus wiedmannii TaxID=1890302 RepID=UPI0014801285|nr:hypothetical protein [Bacillus wiedmannii]